MDVVLTPAEELGYGTAVMVTGTRQATTRLGFVRKPARTLPGWVIRQTEAQGGTVLPVVPTSDGALALTVTESAHLLLVSVVVGDAVALPPLALQRRTSEAYAAVRRTLGTGRKWEAVRIWNWIPGIRAIMADGLDRYKVFNAGRFSAYHEWYGQGAGFEKSIATATGVGHDGSDLVIQVLATHEPGIPVENPRQIRSYRYSDRLGPMPPCFSRATLTPEASVGLPELLVGGTASVCGEASTHRGDVGAQTRETLVNLAHLVAEGERRRRNLSGLAIPVDVATQLRRFDSLRVFHLRSQDVEIILDNLEPYVSHLDPPQIELVRADICRPELVVEIEGTVTLV